MFLQQIYLILRQKLKCGDRMKKGSVHNKTTDIYYEVYGTGYPLILLHGNGESMRYFHNQISVLSETYQLILIDTRGHGHSSFGDLPLNFDLFADDVIAVMDKLKIDTAHLLSFSDGGNTAITLALHYPQRVRTLILNGANLMPDGMNNAVRHQIFREHMLFSFLSLFSVEAKRKKEILSLMIDQPHFPDKEIGKIRIPTLVIVGEHDMIKQAHTDKIVSLVKNAKLEIIPHADHFAAEKFPNEFNTTVMRFLKQREEIHK